MYKVTAYGKNVTEKIINLGINPAKTFTLKLNFKFNRGFILGLIDGDGDCHYKHSKVRITTASLDFTNQILEHFNSLNIYSVLIKENNYYRISIYRKKEVKKLFEYLYTDWNYYCIDYKRKNMLGAFNYKREILDGKILANFQYEKFIKDFYQLDENLLNNF